ncbi:molybdate ABC transporter substrate-binding protein [Paenibacillus agricola]|uniref:Molybdate ABC transporter substrate-binding protein n=1 Tax=Paenibacillus agricola TaxID=2716264 RepID=A0ABX0J783_9BACL|nr:molybdate ABC transporter substrate-binding protein [Paenibacillus agricola]NHN31039.1 molybdate ABC transporter substrate-binding protein [Paenibacillus agricola]
MKKIIKMKSVMIAIIAVTMLMTGCGTQQDPTASAGNNGQKQDQGQTQGAAPTTPTTPAVSTTSPVEAVELTISAASSMTDALKEIQSAYAAKAPNIKLNFNYGASGALQQQIEQGAPADLFLSAAVKNMKALVDKQLVDGAKQTNLLTNELVVVVPVDSKLMIGTPVDLLKTDVKNVAIGIPESVPAGSYAKEALTAEKLWDDLQPKMVQGKDVRQVLQYIETGNADAGFVYKTDALTSQKVKVAFAVDPKSYQAVEYPIAVVKATKHGKEAEAFYTYLQSKEALDVFIKFGFSVPKR